MGKIYDYVRYTLRFLFFFVSNFYTMPCYLLFMTLLKPLRFFAPDLYWRIEARLFRMMTSVVVTWLSSGDYRILECGEDVRQIEKEEAMVLVNHQSTADTPLMMLGLYNKGLAGGTVMWVMYSLFKYTNFGLASMLRQDFFIDQGKEKRDLQIVLFKKHLTTYYLQNKRKWIIVFPEGGFLYKRLESSQEYARKNNFPVLKHTTLPRLGAVQAVLNTVGEPYEEAQHANEDKDKGMDDSVDSTLELKDPSHPLKWIIDITIAYKGGEALDMLGMCLGSNPTNDTLMHWRAYRVRGIPREETALRDWLYKRYAEKDEMLRAYYEEGTIPGVSENAALPALPTIYIKFDFVELVLNNVFFVTFTYVQWVYFWSPLFNMFGFLLSYVF